MAEIKERHPSWFKMKLERRELVRQLSPETAVNVLLACWDYLETYKKPDNLSPIENAAFAAFMPDMEESWSKYIKRITNGSNGGRPRKPYGSICPHTAPYGTEEETETDSLLLRNKERVCADKPHTRPRFVPPSVEEVQAYCQERSNGIDASLFVDFYEARGWTAGRGKMRNWKAAVRTWEKRNASQVGGSPSDPPPRRTGHLELDANGEEVVRFD